MLVDCSVVRKDMKPLEACFLLRIYSLCTLGSQYIVGHRTFRRARLWSSRNLYPLWHVCQKPGMQRLGLSIGCCPDRLFYLGASGTDSMIFWLIGMGSSPLIIWFVQCCRVRRLKGHTNCWWSVTAAIDEHSLNPSVGLSFSLIFRQFGS